MFVILATAERASSLLDRVWGVFVLGLTLVTAALVAMLVITSLGMGSPSPGLTKARPWIAGLVGLTLLVLVVAYLAR